MNIPSDSRYDRRPAPADGEGSVQVELDPA